MQDDRQIRPWVRQLATLLDSQFEVPGTSFRFGLDPVLGVVPVVGDLVTLIAGLAIVYEAVRLDAPRSVLLGMVLNLLVDALIGLVPVIDVPLDAIFKANARNLAILERFVSEAYGSPGRKRVS